MLVFFLIGIFIALMTVSYREILAYEPVLNWWFKFGSKFEDKFFYAPIWGCVKCISGQIALWFYALSWINKSYFYKNTFLNDVFLFLYPDVSEMSFNVFGGLFFIFWSILITNVLDKVYNNIIK